jgi:hypothetical protein
VFLHGRSHEASHRKTGGARRTGDGDWRGTREKYGRRMETGRTGMEGADRVEGVYGRGELKWRFAIMHN